MNRIQSTALFVALTAATGFSAFATAQDYGNRAYESRTDSRYDYRYDN